MQTIHRIGPTVFRGTLAVALIVLAARPTVLFAAPAECTGKYADLQSYAGKYLADEDLLAAPAVAARLRRLPGEERLHLERNLDVSGRIELSDCHLVVAGNAAHMGTEQDAMLDVDLASGNVIAAIHGRGRIDIYLIDDPAAGMQRLAWDELPNVVRVWAVKADTGFPQQQPRNLEQPATVRLHVAAAAPSNEADEAASQPVKITADIDPSPAQIAAIRRAAGDLANCEHPDERCYGVSLADLNDDGRPDLIVQSQSAMWCGSAGCSAAIVMATANGYAGKAIGLPNYTEVAVLASKHHGMHDLQFDRYSPIWKWNGEEYDIDKVDLPGSDPAPWQTRQAAGRTLAMAVPVDSTIQSVSVFCDQGKPALAMLMKMAPPARPVTLTWVFRGWTVNVPMGQGNRDATLWLADLSSSDLPLWLAHRGNTSTMNELAGLATESFLRINGGMQGEISLQDSTAATQAALGTCYRYRRLNHSPPGKRSGRGEPNDEGDNMGRTPSLVGMSSIFLIVWETNL